MVKFVNRPQILRHVQAIIIQNPHMCDKVERIAGNVKSTKTSSVSTTFSFALSV